MYFVQIDDCRFLLVNVYKFLTSAYTVRGNWGVRCTSTRWDKKVEKETLEKETLDKTRRERFKCKTTAVHIHTVVVLVQNDTWNASALLSALLPLDYSSNSTPFYLTSQFVGRMRLSSTTAYLVFCSLVWISRSRTCNDNATFMDSFGMYCETWADRNCVRNEPWMYPQDSQLLLENCPYTCGMCNVTIEASSTSMNRIMRWINPKP